MIATILLRSVRMITRMMILAFLLIVPHNLSGQNNFIKGYVINKLDGTSMPFATLQLEGTAHGTLTNESGFFILRNLPSGHFTLIVSSLGFKEYRSEVEINTATSMQIVVRLEEKKIGIEEVQISAQVQKWKAQNQNSITNLTPKTINRIPSFGGQSDLAQFLQVVPGAVTTGDQGGQIYLRGGSPITNRITLDGLTIISPFHSNGFSSVFDSEIIGSADILTGGFNAQYGGKISSVMDIKTKDANKTRLQGKLSTGTLGLDMFLEGPLMRLRDNDSRSIAFMVSMRNSYMDKISQHLYPYLENKSIPSHFNDFYGKFTLTGRKGDQLNINAQYYSDFSRYSNLITSSWTNKSMGVKLLLSPPMIKSQLIASFGVSEYSSYYKESTQDPRLNKYDLFEARLGTNNYYPGFELKWAIEIVGHNTFFTFKDINSLNHEQKGSSTEFGGFTLFRFLRDRWIIEPGFHFRYYASQNFFSPEPRLQIRYNITDRIALNISGGLYSQEISSTTAEQDIVNTFQGFFTGIDILQEYFKYEPIKEPIQKAWHAIAGFSFLPVKEFKINIDAYVKDFYRLVNSNRNRVYEDYLVPDFDVPDYLKRFFIIEKGLTYGVDLALDYTRQKADLWFVYSFSYSKREDEFFEYFPHFDRRHNLNILYNQRFRKNWNLKFRWTLGSGFPLTQTLGYYEDLSFVNKSFIQDFIVNGKALTFYSDYNGARLPWYHRLDVSIFKTWNLGRQSTLDFHFSIMNLYNRRNVFYLDRATGKRIDQLPILPTAGLVFHF